MILSYKDSTGEEKKLRFKPLPQGKPVSLGRSPDADVTINDSSMSRVHSAIRYWDDIFVVRDMHSSNGTFLNGEKIDVAQLNPGDVLKAGDTEFTVVTEDGVSRDVTMRYDPRKMRNAGE